MVDVILLGIGVGLALGLTGGGGMLAVPALVLGLNLTMQEAMPIALIAIGLAALVGTIDGLSKKIVRYKAAAVMALAGILISPFGIWLANIIPPLMLTSLFSLLLVFFSLKIVTQTFQQKKINPGHQVLVKNCLINPSTGRFAWSPRCFFTLSGIGSISGIFTGMLGVGGGFIIAPSIRQYSDLNSRSAVATSLMVISLITAGTVFQVLLSGITILNAGLWFIAASIMGMFFARILAPYLSEHHLQYSFALLALVAAFLLLQHAYSLLMVT